VLNASGCSLWKTGRSRTALVALWCMVATARADSPSDQADVLFQRGKDLMAAGKIAEACAAFDESQQLDATPATMLNQANCREQNGQLATARALYLEAARQTSSTTDARAKKMHASATSRAAKLEPQLSTLRISVPAASLVGGLEVSRDGATVAPTSWNEALPIDGGTYRISARAPGRVAWSGTVTVAAERDAKVVEVPRLPEPPRMPEPRVAGTDAPPPRTTLTPPSETPRMAVTEETTWTGTRKLAVGLAAGGVAGLATGSVLGVLSNRKRSDAEALCPDPRRACDAADRANPLSTSASHLAIGADVAFGLAAGAATAAVVLWMTGAPESQHGVAITPAASPGQLVITASRSW
jgi:hypothetical protein